MSLHRAETAEDLARTLLARVDALTAALTDAREELFKWAYGDFEGDAALAEIDEALGTTPDADT